MEIHEAPFSWQALIRITLMAIIVFLCWKALGVFPIILIAFVLAAALYPIIKRMHKKTKIPFVLCILVILVVPIIPFVFLGFMFVPRIGAEIPTLLASLNSIVVHSSAIPSFLQNFNLTAYIQSHIDYTTTTVNVALSIVSVLTTVILTFFLLYDYERLLELFLHIIPTKEKGKVKELMGEVAVVTGKYIRGNVLISLICGVVIFLGLTFLHVSFALPLALFAAILDLLPLVGQTLGAIPAVIIGFGVSPLTGVLVIVLHLIYQQVENAVISPVIYNKALNLIPSVSFLAVLLGGGLFGVLGAFLSLPVAASIPAIVNYRKNYKARHESHTQN